MEFWGPFPSEGAAMSYAEITRPSDDVRSWWVTELIVPGPVEGIGSEELAARGWRECGPNGLNGKLKEFPRSSAPVKPAKTARPSTRKKPTSNQGPISAHRARIAAKPSYRKLPRKKKPAKKAKRGKGGSSNSSR